VSGAESLLTEEHAAYLARFGVNIDVALAAGVRSRGSGIVFSWTGPDGRTVEQFRPDDDARGEGPKYLWTAGEELVLWVHPSMRYLLHTGCPIDIVEGTKQYLATVSHAPEGRLATPASRSEASARPGRTERPRRALDNYGRPVFTPRRITGELL
jgi:hypothetical protein